jgi:hypothetical protein
MARDRPRQEGGDVPGRGPDQETRQGRTDRLRRGVRTQFSWLPGRLHDARGDQEDGVSPSALVKAGARQPERVTHELGQDAYEGDDDNVESDLWTEKLAIRRCRRRPDSLLIPAPCSSRTWTILKQRAMTAFLRPADSDQLPSSTDHLNDRKSPLARAAQPQLHARV